MSRSKPLKRISDPILSLAVNHKNRAVLHELDQTPGD